MSNAELKTTLGQKLDEILSHTFLITGENRAWLTSARDYVADMTDQELTHLQQFVPKE